VKKLPEKVHRELVHFYQTAAGYGARIDAHDESAYQEYVSFIRRFADKHDTLLDIGCGTGLSSFMLGKEVGSVVGVDISPIFINIAEEKRQASNVRFECTDILHLPFGDGSFDIVSSFLTLEHIYDVEGALSEMVRVVKPGGLVIILSPNLLSPFTEVYNLIDFFSLKKDRARWQQKQPIWKSLYLAAYKTARIILKKLSRKVDFIYRLPILEDRFDMIPDQDAVYLSNPLDLKLWLTKKGMYLVKYQHETRWGRILPSFATGIHIVARKNTGEAYEKQG
jgi:ubiquinone/menaquinone biosynthesis C-methylase UbiE